MTPKLLAMALCMLVVASAQAGILTVNGNSNDRGVKNDGNYTNWAGQPNERIGYTPVDRCFIYVFELPALPSGEGVVTADFKATVTGGNDYRALYQKGVDVYGVRMSDSSTVLGTDYYGGAFALTGNNGTGIQENFVYQPNSVNAGFDDALKGDHHTDAAADARLAAWLQSLYDDAAYNPVGTNYAFIRVNSHADISDGRYFTFGTANNSTVEERPVLTIESGTIPEPASIALLAIGGTMMLKRRHA